MPYGCDRTGAFGIDLEECNMNRSDRTGSVALASESYSAATPFYTRLVSEQAASRVFDSCQRTLCHIQTPSTVLDIRLSVLSAAPSY